MKNKILIIVTTLAVFIAITAFNTVQNNSVNEEYFIVEIYGVGRGTAFVVGSTGEKEVVQLKDKYGDKGIVGKHGLFNEISSKGFRLQTSNSLEGMTEYIFTK